MCRTRRRSFKTPDLSNLKLQRWSQLSRYSIADLENHMRKVLIYYPKKPSTLKPILSELNQQLVKVGTSHKAQLQNLYRPIQSRYRREHFTHQHINLSCITPSVWPTCGRAHSMHLSQQNSEIQPSSLSLCKIIKANKNLQILQIDGSISCLSKVLECLRFMPCLKSIHIGDFVTGVSPAELRRSLYASRRSLETITFAQASFNDTAADEPNDLIESLRMLPELSGLRKLNLCGEAAEELDINSIPFSLLHKRGISYNIRICYPGNKLILSVPTQLGLDSLEYLGLNVKRERIHRNLRWDTYQENQVKAQESTDRVLLLDIETAGKDDMCELLQTCRNISTLDITLSDYYEIDEKNFSGLKKLTNLQNLMIELANINYTYQKESYDLPDNSNKLFENLTFCAQSLRSFNLHLNGEGTVQETDVSTISAFFEACTDTLTNMTLKFTHDEYTLPGNVHVFYDGVAKLKRIERLSLIYEEFSNNGPSSFARHSANLKRVLMNKSLKEFCLSAPNISFEKLAIPFKYLDDIEKLQLDVYSMKPLSHFLRKGYHFCNSLRDLELFVRKKVKNVLNKLLARIQSLSRLEAVKLMLDDKTTDNDAIIDSLKMTVRNNQSLKLLAYGKDIDVETIRVFSRTMSYSTTELDDIFGRNLKGLPKRRQHVVYFC